MLDFLKTLLRVSFKIITRKERNNPIVDVIDLKGHMWKEDVIVLSQRADRFIEEGCLNMMIDFSQVIIEEGIVELLVEHLVKINTSILLNYGRLVLLYVPESVKIYTYEHHIYGLFDYYNDEVIGLNSFKK